MDLLSYGDRIPEGDYRLHSAFANAINFRRGGILVSLVPPAAGPGPTNLVLSQLPPGARRLRASRFYFYIDENRLRKEPELRYSSAMPEVEAAPEHVAVNLRALARLLALKAPEKSMAFVFDPARERQFSRVFDRLLLERFKKGLAAMRAGNYAKGARTLRGLGLGLTPSGDDFLGGMLAGLNFARSALRFDTAGTAEIIYAKAGGGSLLSGSLLRASYDGRVNAKIGRLLAALAGPGGTELSGAAEEALACGHTSGADFCSGLVFSLQELLAAG